MAYGITGGIWDDKADTRDEHSWIEVLEGDAKGMHLVDATQDDGALITKAGLGAGRAMAEEGMPTKLLRGGAGLKVKPLLDVERWRGRELVVCERVKDIVEELEPGVHRFFPMELYVGKDYQRTDYFLNICNRLDALDRERTYPLNKRGFFYPEENQPRALVFSTEKIGNHHIWIDKFVPGGGPFISDVLAERLQAAAISGLSYHYIPEA